MKAAIFDLDGTLLDSMGMWARIDEEFLAKRGLPLTEDYAKSLRTLTPMEAAIYTIKRFNLPDTPDGLIFEWNEMARYEYGNRLKLKPYAAQYLRRLKALGIKLAIATNSPGELYGPALKNNGVYGLFDVFLSSDVVGKSKNHPDIYLEAARLLNVHPQDCVVFEDIPEAILTAKRAGMTVYGVYDKSAAEHEDYIKTIAHGFIRDFSRAPEPEI